jgi:adenylate cyclase
MGEDELGTVRTLEAYREMLGEVIRNYSGRVVDSPGDNVLAEFASVVDAVESAVEIQQELKAKNAELPENRRMEFRIGINLGDVIEEGERIYGDGVNVAARIEGLAEGGGICISRTAFDQVKNKLKLGYEYLGEHSVKNIAEPVRVYRVLMEPEAAGKVIGEEKLRPRQWRGVAIGVVAVLIIVAGALAIWNFYFRPAFEPASIEQMAFPLPDKPSIAVLPFENMSGDPDQEYFSDGITENIITALSKVHNMFVIARNSTFTYKNRAVKIQQVAEDLGVRYVLEGSVQKTGDRVRITAQLIDAITGNHLWAERYDRDLTDIFALQDEITKKIITSLHVELTVGEDARLYGQTTDNFEAYLKFLQGNAHLMRLNKDATILARKMFKEAVALDPNFIFAYVNLAWTHTFDAAYGWAKSRVKSLEAAEEFAQKALSLDDSFAGTYGVLGSVQLNKGNLKEAVALREKAIALAPNSANYHALLGIALLFTRNRTERAIKELKIANRLDPFPPNWILHYLGEAYRVNSEYEKAVAIFKKTIKSEPDYWLSHLSLSACYGLQGREEEARAAAAEVLRIDPNFSIKKVMIPFRDKSDKTRTFEALRKAGLPETPPLPLPDKPSIAVLPFTNLSDDPKQEYFVDGMTDDLITDLSKISGLFVIARNSVFRYKGKPVDIKKVGRELGVKHVLEGSVRKAGNQVRINAQLIDASTGGHLWAERYDGKMDDVFALQDKITQKIVTALAVKLTGGEKEQVRRKETDNIAAYDAFLKGWGHYLRHTPEDYAKALSYFEEATELDLNYARAYASMALIYSRVSKLGKHWQDALDLGNPYLADRRARKYLEMAMKNPTSTAYRVTSVVNVYDRRYEAAIVDAGRALGLDPNDSGSHENMAFVLIMAGRPQEAFDFAKKAMRLDPYNLANPLYYIGLAHFSLKEFRDAANSLERALTYSPRHLDYLLGLSATYGHLGRKKEAKPALDLYWKILGMSDLQGSRWAGSPRRARFSIMMAGYYPHPPFKDTEITDLFDDGLVKAGIDESRPLK